MLECFCEVYGIIAVKSMSAIVTAQGRQIKVAVTSSTEMGVFTYLIKRMSACLRVVVSLFLLSIVPDDDISVRFRPGRVLLIGERIVQFEL